MRAAVRGLIHNTKFLFIPFPSLLFLSLVFPSLSLKIPFLLVHHPPSQSPQRTYVYSHASFLHSSTILFHLPTTHCSSPPSGTSHLALPHLLHGGIGKDGEKRKVVNGKYNEKGNGKQLEGFKDGGRAAVQFFFLAICVVTSCLVTPSLVFISLFFGVCLVLS